MWLHRKLGLVCTLLASLPFTRIPGAQSPIADLLPLQGHILSPPAPDARAHAIAIHYPVIVKAGPKGLEVAGTAPDSPPAVRKKLLRLRVKSPGWWPTKRGRLTRCLGGRCRVRKVPRLEGGGPATYCDGGQGFPDIAPYQNRLVISGLPAS